MQIGWLDRPVDESRDHILAPPMRGSRSSNMAVMRVPIALEPTRALWRSVIGSASACAMSIRQRPLANNDLARRAAELAERADAGRF